MDFLQQFNNKDLEVESDGLILGSYVENVKDGQQGGPPLEEDLTERKKKVRFGANASVSVFEKYLPQPEAQKTSNVLQNLMKSNIAALTGRSFSSASLFSPSSTQQSSYGMQSQQQRPQQSGLSSQFMQQQQQLQLQQQQHQQMRAAQQRQQQEPDFKQPGSFTPEFPQLVMNVQTQSYLQQPPQQPQQSQQPLSFDSPTMDDFKQEIAALTQENDQLRGQLAQLPLLLQTIETLKSSNAAMAKENAEILDLFEKGELSLEAEIAEKDEVIKNLHLECDELSRLEKEHHIEMETHDAKLEQLQKQNQKLLTENQDLTSAIEEMEVALAECRQQLQQFTSASHSQPATQPHTQSLPLQQSVSYQPLTQMPMHFHQQLPAQQQQLYPRR